MFLLAGLGNPGPKYGGNRHNVGFMVAERLADRWGAGPFRDKFKGRFAKAARTGGDVVLLEPQTYMNLSGESVQAAMAFFKVPLSRVLVVHDELDLPFGTLRVKIGGGAAGHNGLKSITKMCGGNEYLRLRVGIDRPTGGRPSESWVLSDFSGPERAELPDLLDRVCDVVEVVVAEGPKAAMNRFHGPVR